MCQVANTEDTLLCYHKGRLTPLVRFRKATVPGKLFKYQFSLRLARYMFCVFCNSAKRVNVCVFMLEAAKQSHVWFWHVVGQWL